MVRRSRLEKFSTGKVPMAIEKTMGAELGKLFEYTKPVPIKKVIRGLYKGEPIAIEEVFKASEKPFESRKSAINEVFPKGAIFGHKK